MSDILLHILREAKEKHGYLCEDVLKEISTQTGIPISRLYGVASFYSMIHTEKQGKNVIDLCGTTACYLNNARKIEKMLEKELGIRVGETTKDGEFSLYKASCIGCCDNAPAMLVNGKPFTNLTEEKVRKIIKKCRSSKRPI